MNIYLKHSQDVMGKLDVDYYVPITVRFAQNDKRPRNLLLYNIVNNDSSLIEFSINSSNKKLVEITVVSINSLKNKQIIRDFPKNIIKSNPDFDISLFNNSNIVTETIGFEISMWKNEITILFCMNCKIENSIKMEHVIFFLDKQNQLIGLKFFGFSMEQWEVLCDSLKKSIK